MPDLWPAYAIIALALAFDFVNGFHDAANSIATIVSTRVMKPQWAVAWAAFFNFIAFLFFGLAVAKTIGKGVVDQSFVTIPVIAGGLVGAIVWDLITWYGGLPTSSSHALVGGFAGAALAHGGFPALLWAGLAKIGVFIILAPVFGMVVGFVFMVITYWVFRRATPGRVTGLFRKLQLVSAAAYSLGHGGNDAQKTMGIILAVLIATWPTDYSVKVGNVATEGDAATCEYGAGLDSTVRAAIAACGSAKAPVLPRASADATEMSGRHRDGRAVEIVCRRMTERRTSVVVRGDKKLAAAVHASLAQHVQPEIPFWVVIACHAAMGLGTMMGGWRIVKTMGQKICNLQPVHGFSAETAGALCLYGATGFGIPVSTTHTITGAILGVGSTRGLRAVKWAVAGRVIWAWVLTIPASALIAAGSLKLFHLAGWR